VTWCSGRHEIVLARVVVGAIQFAVFAPLAWVAVDRWWAGPSVGPDEDGRPGSS
jgi:hypothetical protein